MDAAGEGRGAPAAGQAVLQVGREEAILAGQPAGGLLPLPLLLLVKEGEFRLPGPELGRGIVLIELEIKVIHGLGAPFPERYS